MLARGGAFVGGYAQGMIDSVVAVEFSDNKLFYRVGYDL